MHRLTPKTARLLADLTQQEMARKLGISLPTYRKYEMNPEQMSVKKVKKFCEIVEQPVSVVFFCPETM
jgi:DNA-binding XRE family transcriptional regulator